MSNAPAAERRPRDRRSSAHVVAFHSSPHSKYMFAPRSSGGGVVRHRSCRCNASANRNGAGVEKRVAADKLSSRPRRNAAARMLRASESWRRGASLSVVASVAQNRRRNPTAIWRVTCCRQPQYSMVRHVPRRGGARRAACTRTFRAQAGSYTSGHRPPRWESAANKRGSNSSLVQCRPPRSGKECWKRPLPEKSSS